MTTTIADPNIAHVADAADDAHIAEVAAEPAPQILEPAFPVHPLAASFPLLEGEELDALVEDIRNNGLLNPIVLDTNGQLIDGRNRLKACALAGVEATFTTIDRDPIAYILGANVTRRHLSKGQCAMAYAMAYPVATEKGGRGKTSVSNTGVSNEYVTKARFVLHHAPDLAAKVMAGSSLTEAYMLTAEQKREREAYERLRAEVRDQLDTILDVCTRLKTHTDKPAAFLAQAEFLRAVRSEMETVIESAKQLAAM